MFTVNVSCHDIEVLKSKTLNNQLVSELLSHDDFQKLLSAMEVYIDKKLLPHMNQMNAVYKLAETSIKENYVVEDGDEIIEFLQNSVIDEDEFLRYRISERFNEIMKSLFETHKKDGLPLEQNEIVEEMKDLVQTYLKNKESETDDKAKALLLCKQLGLNAAKLDDEEWKVLMKVLGGSPKLKQGGANCKGADYGRRKSRDKK